MKRKLLISFLILLHLIPIWLIKYFPSQDGPSHLYNAQILKEYNNPDYKFSEYYDLNLTLFPNWFSHLSLAALMYIFPPLIAEKVLLSIYIVLFPLSLFYFLNATEKRKTLFGFLGFLYIYNYLFHMGFYNFVFSVPLFFFTVGYWWKNRDSLRYREIIVLNILLWATYLCHLVSYLLAIISLFVLSVAYFRTKAKKTLLNFFYLSPSYLPFLNYAFSSNFLKSSRAPLGFWRLPQLIIDFISMKSLVSYSKHQFIVEIL